MRFFLRDMDIGFGIPAEYFFKTNKYRVDLYWDLKSPTIQNASIKNSNGSILITFNSVKVFLKKNRKFLGTIPSSLFFSILPDLDDMINYTYALSDRKVNLQIEKSLKLRAFL